MKRFYVIFILLLLILPILHLRAQVVDILWQGETYTPPFYEGRSLWSKQSRITLVAIPQGLGSAANLNYKWTRNGTVLGNINGIGRNYISFLDSILSRPQIIKVEILSGQNVVLASTFVTVTPTASALAVYENNPLYGFMFHRETSGTHPLKEKEITFTAFPFFFSTSNRMDDIISYEWRTNVGEAETKNSVTYRSPDNTVGSSQVSVSASNKNQITQDASKNFLIEFGNQ